MISTHILGKKLLLFIVVSLWILLPIDSQAADVSLSPQSGNFGVGDNFSLRVLLDSPGEAVNAVSGQIIFPVDLLEVVSLSKGSLINFWVEQPNFSNAQGIIRFEGVTFNPGFSGVNGQVATIVFRGKKTGEANVRFQNALILANDGEGTDITEQKRGSLFTISPRKTSAGTSSTLKSVAITSLTHPDPTQWYKGRSANFSLSFVSGTEVIALAVDTQPETIPSTTLKELISSYTTTELADGEWYLHARSRSSGRWGESSHFLFRIDTEPPQAFPVKLVNGLETTVSRPEIVFGTVDALSGLNRYEILIDNQLVAIVKAKPGELYHLFRLPYQFWGEKKVQVIAIDNAGNSQQSMVVFTITPNPGIYLLIILLLCAVGLLWLIIRRKTIVQPEPPKPVISHGIPPEKSTSLFETSYSVEKDIATLESDLKNLIDLKNEQKAFAYLKGARLRQLSDADIHKELSEVGWAEEEIRTLLQEESMLIAIHKKIQDNLGKISEESQEVEN